ncbi:hypothetical protein DFH06DRAFT_1134186 [Mycena polygramma]|nr:hypothetical protein DFH06DRAFT_1134186 [Mycena polygramma]
MNFRINPRRAENQKLFSIGEDRRRDFDQQQGVWRATRSSDSRLADIVVLAKEKRHITVTVPNKAIDGGQYGPPLSPNVHPMQCAIISLPRYHGQHSSHLQCDFNSTRIPQLSSLFRAFQLSSKSEAFELTSLDELRSRPPRTREPTRPSTYEMESQLPTSPRQVEHRCVRDTGRVLPRARPRQSVHGARNTTKLQLRGAWFQRSRCTPLIVASTRYSAGYSSDRSKAPAVAQHHQRHDTRNLRNWRGVENGGVPAAFVTLGRGAIDVIMGGVGVHGLLHTARAAAGTSTPCRATRGRRAHWRAGTGSERTCAEGGQQTRRRGSVSVQTRAVRGEAHTAADMLVPEKLRCIQSHIRARRMRCAMPEPKSVNPQN